MKNLNVFVFGLSLLFVSCTGNPGSGNQEPATEAATGTEEQAGFETKKGTDLIAFNNEEFYDENGEFIEEKAKEAILSLMEYHGYPIFPELKEKLWVSDYGTGQFTKLGLAAYLFVNNEKDQYMLMDLFLLPGQMLPEHWHLDGGSNPAKLEGWAIRFGESFIVGEGEDNLSEFPEIVVPKCHMNGEVTTKHVVLASIGSFTPQDIVYSRHWQFGGPEGAIITEVANVHTDIAVRHSDKAINDNFLGI